MQASSRFYVVVCVAVCAAMCVAVCVVVRVTVGVFHADFYPVPVHAIRVRCNGCCHAFCVLQTHKSNETPIHNTTRCFESRNIYV